MDDPREEPIDTPEWRILIERKLGLLRENILGSASSPRPRIADLSRECALLVAVVAWFEAHGNISRAAERLGTSRRALRQRITIWLGEHPQVRPTPRPRPPTRLGASQPSLGAPEQHEHGSRGDAS